VSILERMKQAMSLLTKAQLLAKRLRAAALDSEPGSELAKFYYGESDAVIELCEAEL
jgi:hypothetical protein